MNILQVSKVKVVDTPIVDTRLVLNWTPSSTTCSTSHWWPQSAPQLPLVTFETLCWNRKHVLSNLGSLTGVHSHFYRCPKKVAVTFGCTHLTCPQNLIPTRDVEHWEKNHFSQGGMLKFTYKGRFLTIKIAYEKFLDWKSEWWKHALVPLLHVNFVIFDKY
jgi:hypothetical protein